MKNNIALTLTLASLALLSACASKPEGELTGTVGELYNDGMDQMAERRWSKAVHTFEELQRQYPYSGWATRAEMMSAYAYLKNGDEEEAIATADSFIKLHPGHSALPYMYYLKGIAHYNRMVDVNRDQSNTAEAAAAFEEVVNRYPDSIYARDARMKLTLTRDHLAGKEMVVGRFYQQREQYLPAINRFKKVVTDYQTTSQTPEALYRLTESYVALGVYDEARRNAAILGSNYPNSSWYNRAYSLLSEKGVAAQQATAAATQVQAIPVQTSAVESIEPAGAPTPPAEDGTAQAPEDADKPGFFSRTGSAVGNGFKATGSAIGNGFKATGSAIGNGFKATGRAIGNGFSSLMNVF